MSHSSFPGAAFVVLLVAASPCGCGAAGDGAAGPEADDATLVTNEGTRAYVAASGGAGNTGGATMGSTACDTPAVFFPDNDGDGFGVTSGGVRGCEMPHGHWALAAGDCADDEPRAHPAQRLYFPEPYVKHGTPTYDYDCNGYEDSDPRKPGGAPSCGVLSITECAGSGYIATERVGSEGVNVLCGSRSLLTCKPNTLGLLCGPEHATVEPLRCH